MSLYGASAVKDSSQVQIAVYLENYTKEQTYDRLGNNAEEIEFCGVTIPEFASLLRQVAIFPLSLKQPR